MLTLRSRLLFALSALLLGSLFVLPLWRVTLEAPQYPEGLGMQIWLSTITGIKPNDLDNINNLNHYIGMKRIVPESIPELRFMPVMVLGLIALAGAAALTRRRAVGVAFVAVFVILAGAGLIDFYRWEYDYGHNLDLENAIIKVPGMSYQPPLIGSRQLLNFTATSLPGAGGILAILSLGTGLLGLWRGRGRSSQVADAIPGVRALRAPVALTLLMVLGAPARAQDVIEAGPGQQFVRLRDAVAAAPAGARIRVHAGVYAESTIVIMRPLTLQGLPGSRIDGEGARTLLLVEAHDVTITGLTFEHTGVSQVDERAAILVREHARCHIVANTIRDAQFAVKLERAPHCEVRENVIEGAGARQTAAGNAIHAWNSDSVRITGNTVRGHRDGIYFEFVTGGIIDRNNVTASARYGLHFMFSHNCTYTRNTFARNGNGVAVMYSHDVIMRDNSFAHNWGGAAYGLLLKDITNSEIADNRFVGNSTALYLEDASRNRVHNNTFRENGWAVRLLASAQDNTFSGNTFTGNSFDVSTNSRGSSSTFSDNYWDRYRGYDLDRNGIGDVPHLPVRLFSLVVEQSPPAMVVLRSLLVDVLDLTERVIPALTPASLRDNTPRMRPLAGGTP